MIFLEKLYNQLRCPRLAWFPSAGFMANFSHEIQDHCKIDAENTLFDSQACMLDGIFASVEWYRIEGIPAIRVSHQ